MTIREFIDLAERRFGIEISWIKTKASHEMIDIYMDGEFLSSDVLVGKGMGYGYVEDYGPGITIFGWLYYIDNGEWTLKPDGFGGWRRGPNPFPEIPEEVYRARARY